MSLESFTRQYIETALWASTNDDGEPLDGGDYDLADEAREQLKADAKSFYENHAELLETVDDEQAGHDFWLTRNRHGAGFWDRGLGELGQKLTDAAHTYGSSDLYIGDDGKVYVSQHWRHPAQDERR
jgi:hypothetical protein